MLMVGHQEGHQACKKLSGARGADLHMARLMPLPLTISCFSKIQTGFTFLVPAYPGSLGKRVAKQACYQCENSAEQSKQCQLGR